MDLRRVHRLLAFVEHLDVAAQGNARQHVFGAIPPPHPPQQGSSEADGKAQYLDPQAPSHPEVAELMHRDEDGQDDDEGEDGME